MRHLAILAVLFVAPLTAAPVPKAVKAKVPPLAGTVWIGECDDKVLTGWVFTFAEDGTFTYHVPRTGETFQDGTWELNGATLTMRVNDGHATSTLVFTGGAFVGSGVNCLGETWEEALRPKEK